MQVGRGCDTCARTSCVRGVWRIRERISYHRISRNVGCKPKRHDETPRFIVGSVQPSENVIALVNSYMTERYIFQSYRFSNSIKSLHIRFHFLYYYFLVNRSYPMNSRHSFIVTFRRIRSTVPIFSEAPNHAFMQEKVFTFISNTNIRIDVTEVVI